MVLFSSGLQAKCLVPTSFTLEVNIDLGDVQGDIQSGVVLLPRPASASCMEGPYQGTKLVEVESSKETNPEKNINRLNH